MDRQRTARELLALAEELSGGRKRVALRPENKRMTDWLKRKGIDARVKYIWKGSLRGTWRLYNPRVEWTQELADKLNRLGFRDFDGKPLHQFSGNGGVFSVFVRGHDEILDEDEGRGASRQAAVVDLFGEREVMAEVQRMVDKIDRPEGDGENKIEGVDLVLLPSSLGLRVSYNDHWGEDTGLLFRFKQSGKPARVDY